MRKHIVPQVYEAATDFVPETFGSLTTIGPAFSVDLGTYRAKYQMVRCVCGVEKQVAISNLKKLKSCGCMTLILISQARTKHGHAKGGKRSPDMAAYMNMLQRCSNPKASHYKDYGGRGIRVFADWDCDGGFSVWLAYMGPRPSPQHTIDRFPNPDGNYEPGNVRWATREEQANNRRNNRLVTFNNETKTVAQWSEAVGIKRTTIVRRLNVGWSIEDTLTIVPGKKGKE